MKANEYKDNIDPYKTISSEEHMYQDSWYPASKSNSMEANLTTLKQTGLFLDFSPMFDIFC